MCDCIVEPMIALAAAVISFRFWAISTRDWASVLMERDSFDRSSRTLSREARRASDSASSCLWRDSNWSVSWEACRALERLLADDIVCTHAFRGGGGRKWERRRIVNCKKARYFLRPKRNPSADASTACLAGCVAGMVGKQNAPVQR